MINQVLYYEYLGNSVYNYLIALAIFLIIIAAVQIFKGIFLKRFKKWAEKTETAIDDFVIVQLEKFIIPAFYFLAIYFAVNSLHLSQAAQNSVKYISVVIFTFLAIRFFSLIINYSIRYVWEKKQSAEKNPAQIKGVSSLVSLLIWAIGIVFLLDNLGFEISAVITGLGIGGIAVALAAQAILGDLFGYFVIFFDKPFQIGDFIIVDDKMGTVEKVGIKTTRVNSISGEQIIFSNSNLTNSRIHNYKRMEKRRVLFKLGVTYQTKPEHLKEIPQIIKSIIEEYEIAVYDRAHFLSYGDFSLIFEVVYFVLSSEFVKYAEVHHNINIRIFEEFEKRGIEFAYPTQTIFMENSNPKTNLIN